MTTFQAGLNNPDLIFSLGKTSSTSMTDLLFKAQKYMNGEDALTGKGLMGRWKKEEIRSLMVRRRIIRIRTWRLRPARVVFTP